MAARRASAAGVIVALGAAVLLLGWGGFTLLVALTYQGGSSAGTWVFRGVVLSVSGLTAVGLVLLVRRRLRTLTARPLPQRGVNGWLARQPGWRLALFYWAVYAGAAGAGLLTVSSITHHGPPVEFWLIMAPGWAFTAVFQAALTRLIWPRRS